MTIVYDTIMHARGTLPWAHAQVVFKLTHGTFTSEGHYPKEVYKTVTDTSGYFSIDLQPTDTFQNGAIYICEMPDKHSFLFALPTSTVPIQLASLRTPTGEPVYQPYGYFRYVQSTPETVWRYRHGLNKEPFVMVEDTEGSYWYVTPEYVDLNTVEITFPRAVAGVARNY